MSTGPGGQPLPAPPSPSQPRCLSRVGQGWGAVWWDILLMGSPVLVPGGVGGTHEGQLPHLRSTPSSCSLPARLPKACSCPSGRSSPGPRRQRLTILSPPLANHSFKKIEFQPPEAKKFFSTVRKEMALLATSLPDGIMVKTFEDRMASTPVGAWRAGAEVPCGPRPSGLSGT